jgi:hypothetical protein
VFIVLSQEIWLEMPFKGFCVGDSEPALACGK